MQNKFVVKKVYNFVVKNMKTISWSDFDHEIATTNLFDHEFFYHEMVLCPNNNNNTTMGSVFIVLLGDFS